ncbi:hypothetical protein IEN85_00415 [Pelagicoccus sp. NFK12]|uniref:Enterochelin esterase n=1 Tax=Pelagicoccus enzymogenes TaxID=2773457 RepID=A0A927F4K0_9BACT|nr:alpha/beta hydrolase-fold protein [Pelagicoccus enzymogenes]MBD5777955.1 hypothetical protein [Pelagicoccus enzymogenes]
MIRFTLGLITCLPFLAVAQTDYVNIPAPERSKEAYLRQPGDYPPSIHSQENRETPRGSIEVFDWNDSEVYPTTTRQYWIYTPAQYDPSSPTPAIVFQDGHSFIREDRNLRANLVMDSLIHQGLMPPTIGIFVNPGQRPPLPDEGKAPPNPNLPLNRRIEYDSTNTDYAKFLLNEIIPAVRAQRNLSSDPSDWAIVGNSSGGMAAFKVAWQHPDVFGKVMVHNGSFVDLLGGHVVPDWVRKSEPKPLRISLTSGPFDLLNEYGSWWDANRELASELAAKGYDLRAFWGDSAHNPTFAGATLSETLRWIWRDHPYVLSQSISARSPSETVFVQIPAPAMPQSYEKKPAAYSRAPGDYPIALEARKVPSTPAGTFKPYSIAESSIYPGATQEAWLYVPDQYDAKQGAGLAVFMDGRGFCSEKSRFQAPTVFDNLIAAGDMPPTIALFIEAGDYPAEQRPFPRPISPKPKQASNRRVEYDSIDDRFSRFLTEEVMPQIAAKFSLSTDPKRHVLIGNSSGGSCAFTAAWHRPDVFGNVVSHIGSFTAIRGAHHYPQIIRDSEPRPLRIFLLSGVNDQISVFGDWWQANLSLARELEAKRYDLKTVWGDGGHDSRHAAAVFPETLRWIFRDWK